MQLIVGRPGDLFEKLGSQDQVSFTGSAATALQLRSHPHLLQNSIAFTKAGQKCTAIRRIMVPEHLHDDIADAVVANLAKVTVGDPRLDETDMGPLVSLAQRQDVNGADEAKGAFVSPRLYSCKNPDAASHVHMTEAFGPVATLMSYKNTNHAADLLNRGGGSLVASVVTEDTGFARDLTLASAAFHGRL